MKKADIGVALYLLAAVIFFIVPWHELHLLSEVGPNRLPLYAVPCRLKATNS